MGQEIHDGMDGAEKGSEATIPDPYRPAYHFLAPTGWLNDPNGLIQWNGTFHLFYQHNPYAGVWGSIHWGHATSPDLVHWTHEPIALVPSPNSPDEDGCWSGIAVNDNGTPTLMYTGVRGDDQLPCLALGDDDLLTWHKYAGNPVIPAPPAGLEIEGFRDHSVWREDGLWYMAIGSGIRDVGGLIFLYRSADLRNWEYVHPLCSGEIGDGTGTMWECPDFFALDDRHVLLLSPIPLRKTIFFTGNYADQRFTPEVEGTVDWGGHFYAPQTFQDDQGRRIMFGWVWEGRTVEAQAAAGWAGIMSLPRILTLGSGGTIRYTPASELQSLRGEHRHLDESEVREQADELLGTIPGDQMELIAEWNPGLVGEVELLLRCTPDRAEHTAIRYDTATQILTVDQTLSSLSEEVVPGVYHAPLALLPGEGLRLHIFIDHSVLEIYANERVCLSTRFYPTRSDSLGIKFGGDDAPSLDLWAIGSIWQ